MNIYEQQSSNIRGTYWVIAVFMVFFFIIGLGVDVFVLGMPVPWLDKPARAGIALTGDTPLTQDQLAEVDQYAEANAPKKTRTSFPYATIAGLVFGFFMVSNSFANGPQMVLGSTHARPADPENPDDRQFLNVLEEMSIAAGIPRPAAFIVPDPDPNAFATGFSPEKSYVAVTEGLLKTLNRQELQGVVAHEISHIKNYDVRLMTIVAALAGAILLLSDFGIRATGMGGRRSGSGGKGGGGVIFLVLWLLALILAPIITNLLAMAISRKREYLADASGAELTRNPMSLAAALEKIDAAVEPTRSVNNGVAHMCIADPQGSSLEHKESFLADLFCTHPPIEKRIAALKMMSYQ